MFSRGRVRWLVAAVGALGCVPALAHGQGAPSSASYVPSDSDGSPPPLKWYVSGTKSTDTTIAQGGTVTFTSPANARKHNVVFQDDVKPSCRLSTDAASSPPPMPPTPTQGWTGTCMFDQPGAYHFICGLHISMTGTITVAAKPTPPPAPTPSPTPSPTPTPVPATPAAPAATPRAATAIVVARRQTGSHVRGSLLLSRPHSRVSLQLLARPALVGREGTRRVRVGRWLRANFGARRRMFSITLHTFALRALRETRSLTMLLRIAVSAPGATPVTRIVPVRLTLPPRRDSSASARGRASVRGTVTRR